jgi:hypothetical protein
MEPVQLIESDTAPDGELVFRLQWPRGDAYRNARTAVTARRCATGALPPGARLAADTATGVIAGTPQQPEIESASSANWSPAALRPRLHGAAAVRQCRSEDLLEKPPRRQDRY